MKILDVLTEGPNDPHIFKAIFLAGGPGSGKSFVSSKLLGNTGLRVVNSDDIYEYLMTKQGMSLDPETIFSPAGQSTREKAKEITKRKKQSHIDGRLGLIIDGTGKDVAKYAKTKKTLESLGYETMMLFINTSLDIAQERNLMRPRRLDPTVVEKMWNSVQENLMAFQQLFGASNFYLIDNSGGLEDSSRKENFTRVQKSIDRFINSKPQRPEAKRWLAAQNPNNSVGKTKVSEVLNTQATDAKWTHFDQDMAEMQFTASNGIRYQVNFVAPFIGPDEIYPTDFVDGMTQEEIDQSYFVEFEQIGATGQAKQGVAGTGAAAEVFGIVTNAILEFARKRKPLMLYFQAAEVNRRKLYAAIANRLVKSMPGYSVDQQGDKFAVYKKSSIGEDLVENRPTEITDEDLKKLETYADKIFRNVGIDVEFTRHFLDRVNDIRNQRQITLAELAVLFRDEYAKWGKKIAQLGPDAQAVMKDMRSDINIPFVLNWDHRNQELDLVAKTVMRKKNFVTPNPEFPVESKNPNQLRGKDRAKTSKPSVVGSQPHPFRGKLVGNGG